MGSSARIQRQKEHLSKSIIEIAMEILQTDGLESITMRAIADKMEYSAPIVYSYFENKDALLDKLSKSGYQNLLTKITTECPDTNDAFQRLQAVCSGYEEFALENRALYQLMTSQYLKNPEAGEDPYVRRLTELFKSEIRQLIPQGSEVLDNVYRSMIALIHGMICLSFADKEYSRTDRRPTLSRFVLSLIEDSK